MRSNIDKDSAADSILLATALPGKRAFIVGPFGKRIGFAAQQCRALNLLWALDRKRVFKKELKIAVVGAGLAGLTLCAGLLARRSDFELFERHPEELVTQRDTTHRFIHPTVNAWPEQELNPTTSLPFLDWNADICADVISSILKEWRTSFRNLMRKPHFGVDVEDIQENADGKLSLKVKGGPPSKPFDIVILAIGFGDEVRLVGHNTESYWLDDRLDSQARTRRTSDYFVSGAGDGGIIDILRLVHRNFERGRIVVDLARRLQSTFIAKRIAEAESEARRHHGGTSSNKLSDLYFECANDLSPHDQSILAASLYDSGSVTLIFRDMDPFSGGAAPIHKLLLAHAVLMNAVKLRKGTLESKRGKLWLSEDSGKQRFDAKTLIVRHGAGSNLNGFLSNKDIASLRSRQEALNDFTSEALWDDHFFDGIAGHLDRDVRSIPFLHKLQPRAAKAMLSIEGFSNVYVRGPSTNPKFVGQMAPNFSGNIPGLPKNLFGIPFVVEPTLRLPMLSGPGGPDGNIGPPGTAARPIVANAKISGTELGDKIGRIGGLFERGRSIVGVTAAHVIRGQDVVWIREDPEHRSRNIGRVRSLSKAFVEQSFSDALAWFEVNDDEVVSAASGGGPQAVIARASQQIGRLVRLDHGGSVGRVVGIEVSAYLMDDDEEHFVAGGVLVISENRKRPFALPSDSGRPVLNEAGETVGLVLAGDEVNAFVAPLDKITDQLGFSPLTEQTARRWNDTVGQLIPVFAPNVVLPEPIAPFSRRKGGYLFSSESVSEGDPDKVCDRISDEIVDLFFREGSKAGIDPWAIRAACETLATTNKVVIAGETRGPQSVTNDKIESVVRAAIKDIGYEQLGFHWENADIEILLHPQSADIAQRADAMWPNTSSEEGAGDQCTVFGYACDDTPDLMPAPIYYANKILRLISEARHSGKEQMLGPDAKSQITVLYENGQPVGVREIVVSHQHLLEDMTSNQIREIVEPYVREALPTDWINSKTIWHINPTGKFYIGGPDGDSGLTGRKIIVDTYGGAAPHGGGAFSGKDPSKIDRSAAYAARYLAKNIVAAGLAKRCTLQLAYAIGVARPLSIYIDTHGTGRVSDDSLERVIAEAMDLTPRGIRAHLELNRPIYARTSAYGHFGRTPDKDGGFSWEKTDLVRELKSM